MLNLETSSFAQFKNYKGFLKETIQFPTLFLENLLFVGIFRQLSLLCKNNVIDFLIFSRLDKKLRKLRYLNSAIRVNYLL